MQSNETRDGVGYISVLACLCLLLVAPLSGLAQSGLTPILPRMSEHFSADPNAELLVRLMVSGLSFAMIVGSLGSGFVAERIGPRNLLFASLGLFALAGPIGALLDNLYLIVGSRLLLGVATAAAGVITATFITTRIAPQSRDRWLGFYVVVGTFGGVVIMLVAGFLGKLDWRNVFYLHLAAIPVLLLLLPILPPDPRQASKGSGPADGGGGFPWALVLFAIVCGGVMTTITIFLPFHLRNIGLGAPDTVGMIISGSAFSGGVTAFGYGWIRKKLSIVQVFVVGFLLMGSGLVIAIFTNDQSSIIAGMVVFGVGVGFIAPNLFAASAAAAPPARRARTIGLVRAGFYSGPLVAQLPLEPVSRYMGPSAALLGIALVAFAAIAHSILIGRAFIPAEE